VSEAEAIGRAVAAIGQDRPDDYMVAPARHAEELAAKAPALAALLQTAKIETLARQYERRDREAEEAERRCKSAMLWANAAVLATGVLGACIMVAGILQPVVAADLWFVLLMLGLVALVGGGLASMWLFRVREGNLIDAWMSGRAHAESARREYFATLVGLAGGPSDPPLGLLKLEYFRRYQLDVQLAYYEQRGRQHRESADRTLMLGGLAAALAAVASGSAGIVASIKAPWAGLAALGVIGTALAAFAATREAVNQDRRNAERYGRTLAALEILRARLDDVRAGVLAGSQEVLDQYVAAVHEQLSLEQRDWLSGAESTRAAIGRMDEALAVAQKGDTRPAGTG
jgi:SMODS and SLOG-associating 2TM effector domain 1